jgi:HEAT repeat protein
MAGRSPAARLLWRLLRQNVPEELRDALSRLDTSDEAAIRPLLYALRRQFAIRDEIGDSLKRYGKQAVAGLIGSLRGPAPHWTGDLLVRFGEPAVPSLMDALRSRNAQIRQWAADVLGRIADRRAIDPLRSAALDAASNVRFHALKALARIDPIAARPEITDAAERDSDWEVRREAIMALAKQNPGRAVDLLAELAVDSQIGRLACVALRSLGVDGMAALQRLMDETVGTGRTNAALALGWRDSQAISILVAIIADKGASNQQRLAAASAVWLAPDASAMEVDLRILTDRSEDFRLRAMAARALQGAVGPNCRSALTEALGDPNALVRAGALDGLSSGHYPSAVNEIVPALTDQDVYVRTSAAYALSRLGDRRALDPLLRTLSDPEWGVRGAAVNALGSLRDRRAIPALEELLARETDRHVRDETLRVLKNLRMSGP